MAQHALLDDRPGSARGFTLMVLMLIATLVAIGAIAFATVRSSPGSDGLGAAASNGAELFVSSSH